MKDSMGRILLNETNLLLFFNNRLIFLYIQSICQKSFTTPVFQVIIRGKLPALTKFVYKFLIQKRGQRVEFNVDLLALLRRPV